MDRWMDGWMDRRMDEGIKVDLKDGNLTGEEV